MLAWWVVHNRRLACRAPAQSAPIVPTRKATSTSRQSAIFEIKARSHGFLAHRSVTRSRSGGGEGAHCLVSLPFAVCVSALSSRTWHSLQAFCGLLIVSWVSSHCSVFHSLPVLFRVRIRVKPLVRLDIELILHRISDLLSSFACVIPRSIVGETPRICGRYHESTRCG